MPQIFQVLKCYKCFVFQIHQTKKTNKFQCKMCGEKQSIKRHYGIGTGKDCRIHVQKLNVLRGKMETQPITECNSDEEYEDIKIKENHMENIENLERPIKRSKWSAFLDKEKVVEVSEEPMFLGDREVLLEFPQKRKSHKFKAKVKECSSEEYLDSISDSCNPKLKANLKSSNNMINNFESEQTLHNDNDIDKEIMYTGTACQKQLTCVNVDNVIMEKTSNELDDFQTIKKNSKWAQYVDMEEDYNFHSNIKSNDDLNECISNSTNLFSLCDDSELDQVLNV